MQIRTIEEYNHLKKVFFVRSKELNEIQSILERYAETFEPKLEIEDKNEIETIVQSEPNSNKINSQKTKRKPKKKS